MVKLDPHIQFFMCPGPFPGSSYCEASTCNAGDLGREDPLEEGLATHSRILAWRIPGRRSLVGYQSMGLQSRLSDYHPQGS